MAFNIEVNGNMHSVDVDGDTPLLWVLRDVLGMTGTKFGCGMALCGACTVHIDGLASRSCITPVESVGHSAITTIEAIGATAAGAKIPAIRTSATIAQCRRTLDSSLMTRLRANQTECPVGRDLLFAVSSGSASVALFVSVGASAGTIAGNRFGMTRVASRRISTRTSCRFSIRPMRPASNRPEPSQ
jgi:isoquinoline 1-oxidoreductase alpha subunit